MANTFELISSVTAGSGGAASLDFTSIPNTFTDLCVKYSVRGTNANPYSMMTLKFNNATSGYSSRGVYGNSSSASSVSYSGLGYMWIGYHEGDTATASTFGNGELYIPNYAGSTYKSVSIDQVSENNSTAGDSAFAFLDAGLWSVTDAINKISLINDYGSWKEFSTAYLYGVKNA